MCPLGRGWGTLVAWPCLMNLWGQILWPGSCSHGGTNERERATFEIISSDLKRQGKLVHNWAHVSECLHGVIWGFTQENVNRWRALSRNKEGAAPSVRRWQKEWTTRWKEASPSPALKMKTPSSGDSRKPNCAPSLNKTTHGRTLLLLFLLQIIDPFGSSCSSLGG